MELQGGDSAVTKPLDLKRKSPNVIGAVTIYFPVIVIYGSQTIDQQSEQQSISEYQVSSLTVGKPSNFFVPNAILEGKVKVYQ